MHKSMYLHILHMYALPTLLMEGRTATLLRGPGAGKLSRITAECVHARVRLVGRGPRTLSSRTTSSTSTHQCDQSCADNSLATPARSGRLSQLHPPSAVTVASAAAAVGSC